MYRQDEYTKAQLSLSQDFSDHNLSLMMKEHDIEGLCSVTCSVTGEYLTEDEQVKFFTCLCAFNDTYLHNHKKPTFNKITEPTFNKITEYKILISIVGSLSQGKYTYGNQYRLYTSLKTEVDKILTVINPQVYNKSAILQPKKPKCVVNKGEDGEFKPVIPCKDTCVQIAECSSS